VHCIELVQDKKSTVVGVCMDGDEAASGSVQFPTVPLSHQRGNQNLIPVLDITGELNHGRSASVLIHSGLYKPH
jgi:hypothetical protein